MILAAFAAGAIAAAPAGIDAREAYARRIFLLEADAACALLAPGERAALEAASRQARGALTRAEIDPEPIASYARGRAMASNCADDLVQDQAASARTAFAGWAAMRAQDFPGEVRGWTASRAASEDMQTWRLWQQLGPDGRIGLVQGKAGPSLVIALPGDPRGPAVRAASLQYRDADTWPDFIDPTLGGLFQASNGGDLAGRVAPASLSKRVWASDTPTGDIQPPDLRRQWRYCSLPLAVLTELSELDPRDVARLSVEMTDGSMRVFHVEIGDLAAAMAFLAAGSASAEPAAEG